MYYYRFFPYDSANNYISGSTIPVKSSLYPVEVPVVTGEFTYDGTTQAPTLTYDRENITVSGDLSATEAGEYTLTFSLNDDQHGWADGTIGDKVITWNIAKADNTVTLSKNSGTVKYQSTDMFIVTENTSGGTITVESEDDNWATATVSVNEIIVRCEGVRIETTTITVHTAETTNYKAGTAVYTLTSEKADGQITLSKDNILMSSKNSTDTFTVERLGTGTITVTSNDLQIATVSGTDEVTVTGLDKGVAYITVSVASDNLYTAASATVTVNVAYKIMTVKIDQTNSNPSSCCTYADDALNMTAGSSAWDEWFGEYPVLFKDGAEVVKINPNNYNQDINGNTIDITSGNAGDVMVAFPRRGLKISTDANNVITVSMTDAINHPDFYYYAHQRGTTDKDVFYIGAYEGYVDGNNKLRSLSGKTVTVNKTIVEFRTYARNNTPASNGSGGSGYDQFSFYPLTFIQAMYCLKYKNLNSQAAVGVGVSASSAPLATGGTETWGIDKKNGVVSSSTEHMKIFGIEDLWGNIGAFIDGLITIKPYDTFTTTEGFNNTGEGYRSLGQVSTVDISGWHYIKKVRGTSELGFLTNETSGGYSSNGGSSTTYFCDWGAWGVNDTEGVLFFGIRGGDNNNASIGGIFMHEIYYGVSHSNAIIGSRLMYL